MPATYAFGMEPDGYCIANAFYCSTTGMQDVSPPPGSWSTGGPTADNCGRNFLSAGTMFYIETFCCPMGSTCTGC